MGPRRATAPGRRSSRATLKAVTGAGFEIPEQLKGHPSNAQKTKHYDQIAFLAPELEDRLELSEAGVFDFYEHVHRADDRDLYAEEMGEAHLRKEDGTERTELGRSTYYGTYGRTFQMSDHLPMWIRLRTDFGEAFLKRKALMGTWSPPERIGNRGEGWVGRRPRAREQ